MNKTFNKFVDKNKDKIIDAYKGEDGYYSVLMLNLCDDNDPGRHTLIDTRVSEIIKRFNKATPCTCGECPQD